MTVWCDLWSEGIVDIYFFETTNNAKITVYHTAGTDFIVPNLHSIDVKDIEFQQDGATCHTSYATIDLLCQTFKGRLINRKGDVNWPPRNCDLTIF